MPLTETTRYQLFQGLQETLGPDKASTLMELLPPVGWSDVATKRDLDHLAATFRSDLDHMGTEVRGELATLGSELRGEIGTMFTGMHGEIQKTRAEFFHEQRNQAIAIIGANATITGLLLAAFHLM